MAAAATAGEGGGDQELWQAVVDASKQLLTSCKQVAEAVGRPGDTDGLYAATDQAEAHAAALVDMARAGQLSETWPVVAKFLREAAIATSGAVADLTRAAKAAAANPYDFLTTQAVGNSTRAVADAIKGVVQAADPLKRAAASSVARSQQTQQTQQLPATEAGAKVRVLLCAAAALQDAACGASEAAFVEAAQGFAAAFTAVYTISRSTQLRGAADGFRDQGTTTLSLAKVVFRSREDLHAKERFGAAVAALSEAARVVAFAAGQFSTAPTAAAADAPLPPPPQTAAATQQAPAVPTGFASSYVDRTESPLPPPPPQQHQNPPPPIDLSRTTPFRRQPPPPPAGVSPRQKRSGSLPPPIPADLQLSVTAPASATLQKSVTVATDAAKEAAALARDRAALREEKAKLDRAMRETEALRAQLAAREAEVSKLEDARRGSDPADRAKAIKIPTTPSASPSVDSDAAGKEKGKEKEKEKKKKKHHRHHRKTSSSGTDDSAGSGEKATPAKLVQRSKDIIGLLSTSFSGFGAEWSSAGAEIKDHAVAEVLKALMEIATGQSAPSETPESSSSSPAPPAAPPSPSQQTRASPNPALLAASRAAATAAAAVAKSPGSPLSRNASFLTAERRVTSDMKNMLLLKGPALDFNEWQQMMTKLKLTRSFAGAGEEVAMSSLKEEEKRRLEDRESTFERVVEAASVLSTGLVETLLSVAASVAAPADDHLHKAARSAMIAMRDQLKLLMTVIRIKVTKECVSDDLATVEKISKDSEAEVGRADLAGHVDSALLAAASSAGGHAPQLIVSDLERTIHSTSTSMRILLTQLLAIAGSLHGAAGALPTTGALIETCATAANLGRALNELCDLLETTRTLKIGTESGGRTGRSLLPTAAVLGEQEEGDTKLWDELLDPRPRPYVIDDQNNPRYATLNKLIEMLTSPTHYNNSFLRTFVVTSASFTTPSKLLDKLLERYDAPRNRVEERERKMIQMRVAVLIKYWVETQFQEFDDGIITRLGQFVEQQLKRDAAELGKLLRAELDRKIAERGRKMRSILVPPTDVYVPDEKRSPAAFFVAFDDAEIARQLTLIDSRIFCSIEAKELLDQSWNKPKLQHRSPNVRHMITRANKISFWVAHLVLCCSTHEERVATVSKVIRIAETVRSLNNYHTLMGLIAGINMSAVSRLAKTFAGVDQALLKSAKALEKLMSPMSSFKNYRAVTTQSSSATIPYIGVYLSDLTFIDEGNQDTVNGMINFEKRELIHRVIADLQHYQHTRHRFPAIEPLFSYLSELPACSERDLYELSLKREPRDPSHLSQADKRASMSLRSTKDRAKK